MLPIQRLPIDHPCRIWTATPGQGPQEITEVNLGDPAPATLDDASLRLPGGAYTTFCTFRGRCVLHLDDHLNRLVESSDLSGINIQISRQGVVEMILLALSDFAPNDIRIRLIVSHQRDKGRLYLAAVPYDPPPEKLYQTGVRVVTQQAPRANPLAKLTSYIQLGSELRSSHQRDAYEVLLVSPDGELLEGTSSNFYAVVNAELFTASEGILFGVTRSIILDEARQAGYQVHLSAIHLTQIDLIQEAFITSSSRGVLPVQSINGLPIKGSVPGPITSRLMARYAVRLNQELEPLSSAREESSSPASGPSSSSPRS